jgi:hypothetical protein
VTHRERIVQQALALSPEDRAFVVAAIEESLSTLNASGDDSKLDLLTELKRRSSAYRAGKTTAPSAFDVIAEQRKRQAGEAGA